MKRLWKTLAALAPTALVILGAAAVAVGVGMIYLPAGVAVGGVLAVVAGVVLIRGGGEDA